MYRDTLGYILLALVGLSVIHVAQAAIFPAKGAVLNLTGKTWKNKAKDGNLAIVAFTAPWCGHCRNMAPEFQKAAESLSPLIPFYNVDCDEQENKALCAAEDIKGFPTVKAYTNSGKGRGRVFERERKAGPIIEWASDQIPSTKVKKLRQADEIDLWKAAKPDQPHALLLHPSNPSVPLMWKVLSDRLSDKIHFGFMKDDKGEAAKAIGMGSQDKKVDGVKVVTWTADGERNIYKAGPLKFEPLLKHFAQILKGETPREDADGDHATIYETTIVTSSTESRPVPTQNKSDKLKEQKAKWEEEERRDRLRREKREQERLARVFEDQERVTEEEDAQEDSGPQIVTPVQPVVEPVGVPSPASSGQADTSAPQPIQPEAPGSSTDTKGSQAVQTGQASTAHPDQKSTADEQHIQHDDQSSTTPLEQEAEEFEHGQHQAVWDESPSEERIKDEL